MWIGDVDWRWGLEMVFFLYRVELYLAHMLRGQMEGQIEVKWGRKNRATATATVTTTTK